MDYGQDIINILAEAGDNGLSPKKITKHVYNVHNTLFSEVPYEDVYKAVYSYLQKCCRQKGQPLIVSERRGRYRLNKKSQRYHQLMIDFSAGREEAPENTTQAEEEQSLPLF